jgi:hypothetical protein
MQSTINEDHLAARASRLGFRLHSTDSPTPMRWLLNHQNKSVAGGFGASLECIEAYLDRLEC